MNAFQMMGYYAEKPCDYRTQDSKLYGKIKVAVQRNFMTGFEIEPLDEYEVILWKGMSREFLDSIPLKTIIAIRGRFQMIDCKLMLVAEHVERMEVL